MPQYEVGHLERVAAIENELAQLPNLQLAGNAYRGAGIPDCIRSGETAAERLISLITRSS
jgi:oxygen-dependent protoporphyrinogen oxidase